MTDSTLSPDEFPDVVELNVGGTYFTTCLATLRKYPESMLATMFSGRHRLARDKEGRYFIDRDGTYFKVVLDFLRTDDLPDIPQNSLEHAYNEAQFYGLDPLMAQLENTPTLSAQKLRQDYLKTFDDFEILLDSLIEEARKPLSKCPYRTTSVKIGLSGIMLHRNFKEKEYPTGEGHNCYVTQKAFCIFHPLHTCKRAEVDVFMECLALELSSRGFSAHGAENNPPQCPWCTKWLHEVVFTWW
ncbi:BTB/POZ domain-containing protein KCTD7-like [Branchiostoma lanceolatum]|uniref:BTB/POZ domain-containing protein KCTD7-like n=1 Tax=Branchiostoma lanceolatum TaxID=7740 RepID=UPI0034542CE8